MPLELNTLPVALDHVTALLNANSTCGRNADYHLNYVSGLLRLPRSKSIHSSIAHLIILNSTLQTVTTWTLVLSLNASSNHVQSTGLILKA